MVATRKGHTRNVIPYRRAVRWALPRARGGLTLCLICEGRLPMANADAFSASVIPFEVPEQVRAFAEKGVSQARDNYAKFKDAAESHNGTMEAVFSAYSNGAKEYSAKVMDILKSATSANLDFAQELVGVKSPTEAIEL